MTAIETLAYDFYRAGNSIQLNSGLFGAHLRVKSNTSPHYFPSGFAYTREPINEASNHSGVVLFQPVESGKIEKDGTDILVNFRKTLVKWFVEVVNIVS
mmetsp:Transcript_34349/g.72284  ORF Transcript_34349/g.72284 Transcript_34349/m.72284 type:complete len:99 (+) Transcript_34349:161-457(+)